MVEGGKQADVQSCSVRLATFIVILATLVLKFSTRFYALGCYAPDLHLILSPGYQMKCVKSYE